VAVPAILLCLLGGCGAARDDASSRAREPHARAGASAARAHPRVVEPAAGVVAGDSLGDDQGIAAAAPSERDPSPTGPATGENPGARYRPGRETATLADVTHGIALPPIEAPPQVTAIIQAGNQIARTPYLWGGGHGRWQDKGYDCSGSVSYALAAGGLLRAPLDSGRLMGWGEPGRGRWVTIYTNPGHVYMVVAGLRFDTSGRRGAGDSRWRAEMRSSAGFVARHPQGL
jgi:cell wall-associated NlpC family hydrolase